MKLNKVLNLDNTTAKERHIYAVEDSDHSVLSITNARSDGTKGQIRLINAGFTSMIIDSSFVFTPRQIQGNNGLKVDFIDTRTPTTNFEFRRNGTQFLRLDTALDNLVYRKGIVAGGGIKCNTYNSDGVNDTVNFQQNANTFISLQGDALNRVQFSRPIRVVDAGGSNQADFVESTSIVLYSFV